MLRLLRAFHHQFVHQRRVVKLANILEKMIPQSANVLDVGSGDGSLSAQIKGLRADVTITGIDVLLRPRSHIEVSQFDGSRIPFADSTFDVVLLVDVLHHTKSPLILLTESARVTRRRILLKDHIGKPGLDNLTLRFMDWVGNSHQGVELPYNYQNEANWNDLYRGAGLTVKKRERQLQLYPGLFGWFFGRSLHFVNLLQTQD